MSDGASKKGRKYMDLEMTDDTYLENELIRRRAERRAGKCDFCGRAATSPSCKLKERHKRALHLDADSADVAQG